jgi:hypothetical protein
MAIVVIDTPARPAGRESKRDQARRESKRDQAGRVCSR